jgi:hypothetical protein
MSLGITLGHVIGVESVQEMRGRGRGWRVGGGDCGGRWEGGEACMVL